MKIYLVADLNSDHNPVLIDFELKRFHETKSLRSKKIDTDKFSNIEVQIQIGS